MGDIAIENESKPEEWSLKIIRVSNGYLLEHSDGEKVVVEESLDDNLRDHEQLLFEIRDYFNFQGSKHDMERIQIVRQSNED